MTHKHRTKATPEETGKMIKWHQQTSILILIIRTTTTNAFCLHSNYHNHRCQGWLKPASILNTENLTLSCSRKSDDEVYNPENWNKREHIWHERYTELVNYQKENDGNISYFDIRMSNPRLGNWMNHQRIRYRRGSISSYHLNMLESIGFVWNSKNYQWNLMYDQLVAYKSRYGNCMVNMQQNKHPEEEKDSFDIKRLSYWVNNQRSQYKRLNAGKKSAMTKDRIAKLNKIGFVWDASQDNKTWNKRYQELKRFKRKYGDLPTITNPFMDDSNAKLYNWIIAQRTQYKALMKGEKSSMTEQRIKKLEQIGFIFTSLNESTWEKRFQEVKEFKAAYGHCRVPYHFDGNPKLGAWCNNQRAQYKKYLSDQKSLLTKRRIEKLNAIGFIWDANNDAWDNMYLNLVTYKETHGHCRVNTDDPKLENWVNNQKHLLRKQGNQNTSKQSLTIHKQTQLSKERLNKLTQIGILD